MSKLSWSLAAVLLMTLVTASSGCKKSDIASSPATAPLGGVAVVDLDEIARRIGRDRQMQQQIEQFRDQKNQEVAKVQAELQKQMEDFKTSLGETPTPEQQQQLSLVQRKLAADFTQVSQQAMAALNQFKQQLIEQYRDELRPIALEIAMGRGLHIVITHQDSFQLAVDPRCDITDELATRIRPTVAAKPASTAKADRR